MHSGQSTNPKPYDFVPVSQSGNSARPVGHQKFDSSKIHGRIELVLEVKTAVHVSTGVLILGTDIDVESAVVQPMTQQIT